MSTIILGAGGHGAVVYDTYVDSYRHELCLDVYDDDVGRSFIAPIKGTINDDAFTQTWQHDYFIVAIGNNEVRQKLTERVMAEGARLCTALIHPKAHVSDHASIDFGSVVFAGAVVQARAQVGKSVIINTGATVDHDCVIGDYAHICPGVNLAGNVKVGERTMIGIGSSVIQGVTIGEDIIVGAGSVVIEDLETPGVYIGAPARLIKERKFKC